MDSQELVCKIAEKSNLFKEQTAKYYELEKNLAETRSQLSGLVIQYILENWMKNKTFSATICGWSLRIDLRMSFLEVSDQNIREFIEPLIRQQNDCELYQWDDDIVLATYSDSEDLYLDLPLEIAKKVCKRHNVKLKDAKIGQQIKALNQQLKKLVEAETIFDSI
jgi:hypothetical protein